jgi:hypothetical protein
MSPANVVDPPVATYAVERVTVATNLAYQKLIAAFERELRRFKPDVAERLHQRRAPHGTRSKRNLAPWPARTV